MFDFLKKTVRAMRHADEPVGPQSALEQSHLRLGAFVAFDALPFRMHEGRFLFAPPQGGQTIEAYGRVDLGASAQLHRYYLTDDAWLQVNTTDDQIDEMKLWVFHDTKHPADRDAFDHWLGRGSSLGRATLEYAGKQFRRVWGEEVEWAPPVRFGEDVYTEAMDAIAYRTTHHCMLFERAVEGTDRLEYLLISAELTGEEYCVVFSIGVDVTAADLQIT